VDTHAHLRHLSRRITSLLAVAAILLPTFGVRVAAARPPGATRGGTLRLGYTGNFISFDPAQAYIDDWFLVNNALYNGLYQLDRNGVPQLDLAAAPPVVSADRTVWTFRLRRGVLFSNGTELTAGDVAFSLTRTLDPHLKPAVSWGQTTDTIFKGAGAFIAGKASGVSGIRVLDRYTIRFVLEHQVAVLPYILAESFNFVLPRVLVATESPLEVAGHPVGTGPFVLQAWQKNTDTAVFVRNPRYFRPGLPYLDRVIIAYNASSSVLSLRVEKGELDGIGAATETQAADVQQARSDPRYARYLLAAPSATVTWLNLNVHAAPFTTLALRQAVALAINRRRLVKLLGGQAQPASQLYIPLDPQHDPQLDRHPVYSYDPQRAAALVKASGYRGQQITLLYGSNTQFEANAVVGLQQDLARVGLNVALRGVTDTTLASLGASFKGSQTTTDFWAADYPDGVDLYASVLACGPNADGATAAAHYCDPVADGLVDRAGSLALGTARDDLLRQAQVRQLQAAARVPLVFLKPIDLVSPKVGGFYYEPILGWQIANYWVKP